MGYFTSYFAIELVYIFFKRKNGFINKKLRSGEDWNSKLLR